MQKESARKRPGLWRPLIEKSNIHPLSTTRGSSKRQHSLRLVLTVSVWLTASAAQAQPGSAGFDPSVSLAKHVNLAAQYWEQGNFARAKDEYRKALYYSPNSVEFHEGVLNCSERTKDWSDVADALNRIFTLAPEKKAMYEYEYGMALFYLNKYDDAVTHLKLALASADIPSPVFKPLKINLDDSHSVEPLSMLPQPNSGWSQSSAPATPLPGDGSGVTSISLIDHMKRELLTYENAIKAEAIVIAEYLSCDKSGDIRYNSPPIAHYHILQYLKGPPLNRALPLRYDFHTQYESTPPTGWKFDASLLPEKGSKWIVFIEPAVPERGAFKTFSGSYGRQPATQANLDEVDRLLESHNMKL